MSAKHTPGPWRIEQWDKSQAIYAGANGRRGEGRFIGEVLDDDDDTGECLANARLAVAAPEMLVAAELLSDAWERYERMDRAALGMLRTAIQKARGET